MVLHVGLNNLGTDSEIDIGKGIEKVGKTLTQRNNLYKVLVYGLLPRDNKLSSNRDKVTTINSILCNSLKYSNRIKFVKPKADWILPNGELNPVFYYHDSLHLVEDGNFKFFYSRACRQE